MKRRSIPRQRGMALIAGLLLLVVLTLLGIGMFRSFGTQAKIAGNTREKQRALHAAKDAQAYAEWWVSQPGGGNVTTGSVCNQVVQITKVVGTINVTDPTLVQVCSNQLNPNTVTMTNGPWTEAGTGKSNQVGFAYAPPGLSTSGADAYVQIPMLYIAFLNGTYVQSGNNAGTQINNYRIEASGFGGTGNTVAVVESTYQTQVTYTTLGITSQNSAFKFYSLTGP
jgi:type IV pilus assembly protein PilX